MIHFPVIKPSWHNQDAFSEANDAIILLLLIIMPISQAISYVLSRQVLNPSSPVRPSHLL